MKTNLLNALIAAASTLAGLFVGEGYFLVTERSELGQRYDLARQLDGAVPAYAPWELWQKASGPYLRVEGQNLFPIGGVARKRTVYCVEADGWLVYESDRFGFNNDTRAVDDVIAGRRALDSLFVGDSFVNGACVPRENSYQGSFTKKGRLAFGFGVGGNGPMMYLSAIKEYAKMLKPKHIWFMYFEGNDLPQARAEQSSELNTYLEKNHRVGLADRQDAIDAFLKAEIAANYAKLDDRFQSPKGLKRSIAEFLLLTRLRGRLASFLFLPDLVCEWDYSTYTQTGELSTLINTVLEAKRFSDESSATFHFVYQMSANSLLHECNYAKDEIMGRLTQAGVDVIDTTPLFHGPQPRFELFSLGRRGGHYSRQGYAAIVELMDERGR